MADLAISIETFASDVQRAYRKWISDPPLNGDLRQKYAATLRLLAEQGGSVLGQYRNVQNVVATEGVTASGPVEDAASVAFVTAERAGCERLLEAVIRGLRAVAERLEVPFSADCQNQMVDQWRMMNKFAEQLREIADAVRVRCRRNECRLRFPNPVQNALDELKDQVQLALMGMSEVFAAKAEPAADMDRRVEAMIERAKRFSEVFRDLRESLTRYVRQHLKETQARDIVLANDIDFLLETVGFLLGSANDLFEFAAASLDAARTPDPDIEKHAKELADAVRLMQEEHDALQAVIARYREIVARAPYRFFTRTKPLPEWDALSEQARQYVAAIIRLRHIDPDGEYAAATQATIERELGHPAGGRPSSTVSRWLNRLANDHQIVGIYPVLPTAEQQQKVNLFWISEDAYVKYRRFVLSPDQG